MRKQLGVVVAGVGYDLFLNRFDMESVGLDVEAGWRHWSSVLLDFLLDTFSLLLLSLLLEHCNRHEKSCTCENMQTMVLTESELFERLSRGLGEDEVDEGDLESKEDAIADVVFPSSVLDTDRVDELVEEAGTATPPLENGNTLGTDVEGEQLDEECVSQGVVAEVIRRAVQEDKANGRRLS